MTCNNEKIITQHIQFIKNAVQDITKKSGVSSQILAAEWIENCAKQGEEELVSTKDMCLYCFTPWSYGQYQIKSIPKVKRKGKYKVTALELSCLTCHKKVKVNNSKLRRSKVQSKLDKIQKKSTKKCNKIVNESKVECNSEHLQSKSKKKKHGCENGLKSAKDTCPTLTKPVSQPTLRKQMLLSIEKSIPNPKNVSQTKSNAIQKKSNVAQKNASVKMTQKNIIAQQNFEQRKRMKLQKHLSKLNNKPQAKSQSLLENFLNSVNDI